MVPICPLCSRAGGQPAHLKVRVRKAETPRGPGSSREPPARGTELSSFPFGGKRSPATLPRPRARMGAVVPSRATLSPTVGSDASGPPPDCGPGPEAAGRPWAGVGCERTWSEPGRSSAPLLEAAHRHSLGARAPRAKLSTHLFEAAFSLRCRMTCLNITTPRGM